MRDRHRRGGITVAQQPGSDPGGGGDSTGASVRDDDVVPDIARTRLATTVADLLSEIVGPREVLTVFAALDAVDARALRHARACAEVFVWC